MLFRIFNFLIKFYLCLYVIAHICVLFVPKTVEYMVFSNLFNWPLGNLSNPIEFDLSNVHNFYMNVEQNIKIGVWHYLPEGIDYVFEKDSTNPVERHLEKFLKNYNQHPVIIYAHGNAKNRAAYNRRMLCSKLSKMGYHVFALDYRGYGDSTGSPTEIGIVNDVLVLYNFIKLFQNPLKIFLWGHSLGTGVVTHAAKVLAEFDASPKGVILEAPFLNMSQAATQYVIAPLFYNNPWIINMGNKVLEQLNCQFNNDKNIIKIKSKILIFHAEDDWYIPHDRGIDLFNIAEKYRPKDYPKVELKILDKKHGLGHINIYLHEEIYPMVKEFTN